MTMQPIQLFELASRQAEWLSVRQQVTTTNIANANTPKYVSKDLTPFDAELKSARGLGSMEMARTNAAHMTADIAGNGRVELKDSKLNQEIGVQESGNTVSLAAEMSKMGEVKRQFELNTLLVQNINRMMLTALGK
jgi:flagellar basal-body rod protein FlgB